MVPRALPMGRIAAGGVAPMAYRPFGTSDGGSGWRRPKLKAINYTKFETTLSRICRREYTT